MISPSTPPSLQHIRHILTRDLDALAAEVETTPDGDLWRTLPGILNSVGTIAVHLCGNLRHFIGHEIGGDDYARQRDAEFSGVSRHREEVMQEIARTREVVDRVLGGLDPGRLEEEMPNPPPHHAGRSIGFFLVQLSCHLSRHTGQANYLRRMLAAMD